MCIRLPKIQYLTVIIFFALILYPRAVAAESTNGKKIIAEPSWKSVFGGTVLAAPKKTSYGFVLLSEGNILSACTGNGTVIWRRRLPDIPSQWYCVSKDNFIYLVSQQGTVLSLYSPDGILLWQKTLKEKAVSDPVCGRDGRVFIAGKTSVSCYGTQGTQKWMLNLPAGGPFPLTEMNDGSLLYLSEEKKNGASTGKRISPYGEIVEDIIFTGEITCLSSYENGLIVGFKTGTAGCISVLSSGTKTLLTIASVKNGAVPKAIIAGNGNFCLLYSDCVLCGYDTQKGGLLWKTHNPQLQAGKNFFTAYDGGAYHFARTMPSGTYTVSYAGEDGMASHETHIQTSADARWPLITSSLRLIVCGTNWIVSGYDLKDEDETQDTEGYDFLPQKPKPYGSFTVFRTEFSQNATPAANGAQTASVQPDIQNNGLPGRHEPIGDIAMSLKTGGYGKKEYGYKKRIHNILEAYMDEYMSSSNRRFTNIAEKTITLSLIGYFESADFNYAVPLFLKNEDDPALLAAAMHCAANIGYDPDGSMLEAIERLYNTKKTQLGDPVLTELAEAVYSLCRYMGRPAFITRGKALLTDMLSPGAGGASSSLQTKVRSIMLRFIELEN